MIALADRLDLLVPFEAGRRTYGGLDLASTTDIAAWALIQRRQPAGFNLNVRFYMAESRLDKLSRDDGIPYRQYVDDGIVTIAGERRISYRVIEDDIVRDANEWSMSRIGFDPWNCEQMAQQLFADHKIVVRPFKSADRNAIRVSPNVYTDPAEIARLFDVLNG